MVSSAPPPLVTAIVLQKQDSPYIACESVVPASNNAWLNQSIKTRFTSSSSAIAFPRNLGLSLGLPNAPRLQSFGWNPGIRPEQKFLPNKTICNIISLDEMRYFADRYFKEVHIYFGVIDKKLFLSHSTDFWNSSNKYGTDLEALICGVVALGSYFSGPAGSPAEAEIVEHGRILLDLSTAHPPALLSFKHVAAWILRTIYLRSTTRPHLSWIASCTAMHIADSVGLHREIKDIRVKDRHMSPLEEDLRRRTFWVAMALNQWLAAEYGRARVQLCLVDCKPLLPVPGDLTAQTVAIMHAVPAKIISGGTFMDLFTALDLATALPADSPFLGLLRADVCFCIYRMFRSMNITLPTGQISRLLEIIRVALDGVKFLRTMGQSWWNLIGTPFHGICVLLSLGTSESLAMIPNAMKTLKNTVACYDSHISNEALRTAHALVQGARVKMRREMESLDHGVSIVGPLTDESQEDLGWGLGENWGFYEYFDFGSVARLDDPGLLDSGHAEGFNELEENSSGGVSNLQFSV